MDFDVKLKVDVAFSDEGMMLVLDMKPCEKERKDEEKKKWKMKKTRLDPAWKGKEKKKKKKTSVKGKLTEPNEQKNK